MRHLPWLVFLAACAASAPPAPPAAPPAPATPATPAPPAPGSSYGQAFEPGTPLTATELVHSADSWNGKEVVVKGTIRSVCQKKGCWHRLATDDAKADILVKASRYDIFLPTDSTGRTAIVKGTFTRAPLPLDEAKHLAEDAGEDPNAITEAPMTYGMDAAGVILI